MASDPTANRASPVSLGDALREYLESLKPDQRAREASAVQRFVNDSGPSTRLDSLSPSKVESYAELAIKHNDPSAAERIAALKNWFRFLHKRGYLAENLAAPLRVRKAPRRPGDRTRVEATAFEMTAEGKGQIERELSELKSRVPALRDAIAVAREDKDFRENAPLEAAREALGFNEGRIRELEHTLKHAVLAQSAAADDRSALGSTVRVTRLDNRVQQTYILVNQREANAREQRISVDSPVGRQLLGRRPGDEVLIQAPAGTIHLRVDSVTHD